MVLRFFWISWPKRHIGHTSEQYVPKCFAKDLFFLAPLLSFHEMISFIELEALHNKQLCKHKTRPIEAEKNYNDIDYQSLLNRIDSLAMAVCRKRGNEGNVCCLNPQIMIQTNETLLPNKLPQGHSHAQTRRNWFGFCWYAKGMCSMTMYTVYMYI